MVDGRRGGENLASCIIIEHLPTTPQDCVGVRRVVGGCERGGCQMSSLLHDVYSVYFVILDFNSFTLYHVLYYEILQKPVLFKQCNCNVTCLGIF